MEITVSALVADLDSARATLGTLRAAGVRIVLDNFGTGYSSLYHLRNFQLDKVKIDRSFIQTMTSEGESASIVRALVGLGSGLGLSVAADGIQDAEQELSLIDHGCDVGQGTLFSRPVDAEATRAMFSAARDRGAEGRPYEREEYQPQLGPDMQGWIEFDPIHTGQIGKILDRHLPQRNESGRFDNLHNIEATEPLGRVPHVFRVLDELRALLTRQLVMQLFCSDPLDHRNCAAAERPHFISGSGSAGTNGAPRRPSEDTGAVSRESGTAAGQPQCRPRAEARWTQHL